MNLLCRRQWQNTCQMLLPLWLEPHATILQSSASSVLLLVDHVNSNTNASKLSLSEPKVQAAKANLGEISVLLTARYHMTRALKRLVADAEPGKNKEGPSFPQFKTSTYTQLAPRHAWLNPSASQAAVACR